MIFRGEYFFLSNFYPSPIKYNGHLFPTAEHAYQASKALNEEDFLKVLNANTPAEAKKLGRSIKKVDNWEEKKVIIMKEILEEKFSDTSLKNMLLKVEGTIVEENFWKDTFWGVCDGVGKNILGKLLMNIRDEHKLLSC